MHLSLTRQLHIPTLSIRSYFSSATISSATFANNRLHPLLQANFWEAKA